MPAALGEEQVAGQEPAEGHAPAHAALIPARARDLPPDRLVGREHEPGAVEPRGPRGAAVAVEDADLTPRKGNDLASELPGARDGLRPWGRLDPRNRGGSRSEADGDKRHESKQKPKGLTAHPVYIGSESPP